MSNGRDLAQITKVLDRIDEGGAPPRLSGAPGAFFRRYATERNTVVRLALETGVHIRKDGKLSGAPLGSITLIPIDPSAPVSITRTNWGDLGIFIALCPELMTVISLRTWLSGTSGREAFRNIVALQGQEGVHLDGQFLWSPPGTVTCGRADFSIEPSGGRGVTWKSASFLKATSDDLMVDAHPLDFRLVSIGGVPYLAQFKVILCQSLSPRSVRVVGGFRSNFQDVSVTLSSGMTSQERDLLMSPGNLLMVLLYRQPWERDWTAWQATVADVEESGKHLVEWADFLRQLDSNYADDVDIFEIATTRLEALGINTDFSSISTHRETIAEGSEGHLAQRLASLVRFGGSTPRANQAL